MSWRSPDRVNTQRDDSSGHGQKSPHPGGTKGPAGSYRAYMSATHRVTGPFPPMLADTCRATWPADARNALSGGVGTPVDVPSLVRAEPVGTAP